MERAELALLLGAAKPPSAAVANSDRTPVIIAERDPARFMAAFAAAAGSARPVFLADPAWGPGECAALAELAAQSDRAAERSQGKGWLMIPSGGTGGVLKFARHDEATIEAAVRGFRAHFQVARANSVGVLPLHHVSGLMAWMRAALTGGSYLPWEWKRLEAGDFPPLPGKGWFLSLVPTQLQRLLARPEAIAPLRGFEAVFVGGGPIWPELAERAARSGLPISLSYGLTETAAMVTALLPREFLGGGRSSGRPLPHARVDLTADGRIALAGESIFRGYYPDWRAARALTTEDLGAWEDGGGLRVLGRRDAIIITGGRKVDPAEVEAALKSSGELTDVAVIGVPDADWGEAVTACYPGRQPPPDLSRLAAALAPLASFKHPRRYLPIDPWPRNAQGKLNRRALLAALDS